jgi:hypothetical protein
VKRLALLAAVVLCALATAAPKWSANEKKGGGQHRIALYRVAPGKQLDFLKWMALQDEVAKEAGVPAVELYAHLDGDAWDYAGIWPVTTPEQDKKLDEIRARKGLKVGFPSALEFRELLSWHTDTLVVGPVEASELVAQAVK